MMNVRDSAFWKEKLHLLPARDLTDAPISTASKWSDNVWTFENPTAGQGPAPSTARWDFEMPNGSRFDDPQWDELRDACKRLLWSLLSDSRARWRYKPGSIRPMWAGLRTLARFMAERNYANFGELDAAAFDDYADYVVDQVHRWGETAPNKRSDGFVAETLAPYLKAASVLVQQAPSLKPAGIRLPAEPPWGGVGALEKARQLATAEKGKIPPIPDKVFCTAMNCALLALEGAEETIREIRNRWEPGGRHLKSPSTQLRTRAARLTDACIVLLQGATGLRASEVCGLEVAENATSDWPSCVKVRKSISGLHEIFIIVGRLYKTTLFWTDVEWIVGARPVGSSHVPIPVRAASVLDRLYRPWRTAQGVNVLFTTFSPNEELLTKVVVGRYRTLNHAQKRHFRTCGIDGWVVTSHQWRKTFAQYVIRIDDRLLPALKDHFKHLSLAMTEEGYVNADPELRQLLDDARIQNTVNFIGDIVTGRRKAYGPLAGHFDKVAKDLGMRLGNRSDENRRADIEDLVMNSGMRLYSLGAGRGLYGNCLFRSGTAHCAEGCVIKQIMRAPLWTAAQPDICWECANLVLDDTHGPFWIERLEKVRAAIVDAVEDGNKALELFCRRREAQTLMVLGCMGIVPEAAKEETTDAA